MYVAGKDTIEIIEKVKNDDGEAFYKITRNAFKSLVPQEFASEQTYIAKSGDFLVIKQSGKRTLGLMPLCAYKYVYDEDDYSCEPCERGLKSYGMQDD